MLLPGHVALVTGGARGIGKAICNVLLKNNAKVCITDILEAEGQTTLNDFQSKYGKENVIFHKLNVVNENEFENIVVKSKKHFGHLDILCNNAGIMNEENPKKVVETNLIGVVNGIKIAQQYLENCKREKGGVVINTSSLTGIYPLFLIPTYSSTKQAVVCLTRLWGDEKNVSVTKVKVNSICPDGTMTTMLKCFPQNEFLKEILEKYQDQWLKPEDVAEGVLKILEDNVTGANLVISNMRGVYYHVPNEKDFIDETTTINVK